MGFRVPGFRVDKYEEGNAGPAPKLHFEASGHTVCNNTTSAFAYDSLQDLPRNPCTNWERKHPLATETLKYYSALHPSHQICL